MKIKPILSLSVILSILYSKTIINGLNAFYYVIIKTYGRLYHETKTKRTAWIKTNE